MKWIRYIYNTGYLASYGKYIAFSSLFIFVLGIVFIPYPTVDATARQFFQLDGTYLKYDDQHEVDQFFLSIKRNQGYLCLGTSESSSAENGNYYNFLNNDTDLSPQFSILAGAGRTCGIYVPIFLNHRESVKKLKIIYFINPVYWNQDLCKFKKEYWNRYSSYATCSRIDWNQSENTPYKQDIDHFENELNGFEKTISYMEYTLRRYRKRFFEDLRYTFNPSTFQTNHTYVNTTKKLDEFAQLGKIDSEKIDTVCNLSYSFTHKEWFKPISDNTYSYDELKNFIAVCKHLAIDCHFIIGPYNQRFIEHYSPKSLEGYKEVCTHVKELLEDEHVSYLDASDISGYPGVFVDLNHHSSYGGYLIYQKIKTYIHEKEMD